MTGDFIISKLGNHVSRAGESVPIHPSYQGVCGRHGIEEGRIL